MEELLVDELLVDELLELDDSLLSELPELELLDSL